MDIYFATLYTTVIIAIIKKKGECFLNKGNDKVIFLTTMRIIRNYAESEKTKGGNFNESF